MGDASGSIPTLTTKTPSSEVHSPSGVLGLFFFVLLLKLCRLVLPLVQSNAASFLSFGNAVSYLVVASCLPMRKGL